MLYKCAASESETNAEEEQEEEEEGGAFWEKPEDRSLVNASVTRDLKRLYATVWFEGC